MTRSAVLLSLLVLGGCATTMAAPVAVTRFSLNPDVARGGVASIVDPNALERGQIEYSVGGALARAGFAPANEANARYVYSAEVVRDTRPAQRRRSPITIGVGGATGGYGSGVGLGASFGIGGKRPGLASATRLSVQLRDRATNQVVWEGRAETDVSSTGVSGTGDSDVERLASALFRDFPGQSGRTISVP